MIGDGAANALWGGEGNDRLVGGGGNDSLDGGSGVDLLDLSGSTEAVAVDLLAGIATGDGSDPPVEP